MRNLQGYTWWHTCTFPYIAKLKLYSFYDYVHIEASSKNGMKKGSVWENRKKRLKFLSRNILFLSKALVNLYFEKLARATEYNLCKYDSNYLVSINK